MGFSREELSELGMGAVLHDVGKCKIPLKVLMKPSVLTDDEFKIMKLHTVYGYDIINSVSGLSKKIANVAFQHHEKWDGTGYPQGLKECQIDSFSRIVTVADIYDALTANRIYRRRDMPHEAAEYIVGYSSYKFDPKIAQAFIKNITVYPDGCIVLLNNGKIGRVVESSKNMSIRPKVRVIADKDGPPVLESYTVDLMKDLNVFIVDVLS